MPFEGLRARKERFKRFLLSCGLRVKPEVFIAAVLAAAIAAGLLLFLIFKPLIAVLGFAGVLSLVAGIPITLRDSRIGQIDANLPDALKHMATTLRSGGTVENALSEVSAAEYGPVSADLGVVLRQLREGTAFEDALNDVAETGGSRLMKRCATIIIDGRKAGAGLADIMDSIAEDAREVYRAKRDRISQTTMQSIFMGVSSTVIAPAVFGMVIVIVGFIGKGVVQQQFDLGAFDSLFTVYLMAQASFATVAMGMIRFGNPAKLLIRLPFMVLAALACYETGKFVGKMLLGGAG
jgi:pilus assembly protein TadC